MRKKFLMMSGLEMSWFSSGRWWTVYEIFCRILGSARSFSSFSLSPSSGSLRTSSSRSGASRRPVPSRIVRINWLIADANDARRLEGVHDVQQGYDDLQQSRFIRIDRRRPGFASVAYHFRYEAIRFIGSSDFGLTSYRLACLDHQSIHSGIGWLIRHPYPGHLGLPWSGGLVEHFKPTMVVPMARFAAVRDASSTADEGGFAAFTCCTSSTVYWTRGYLAPLQPPKSGRLQH